MNNCHLQSMLQPCKKCQQRLHVLRILRAFYVDPLKLYCSLCYYLARSVNNRNRLLKISHASAKIIGLPTLMLSEKIDHAILKKPRAIVTEVDHPLSTFFHIRPSQIRYRCITCKTSRYSRSFVPVAIRMLNAKLVILLSTGWIVHVVDTYGIHLHLVVTIPYIVDHENFVQCISFLRTIKWLIDWKIKQLTTHISMLSSCFLKQSND